MRSLHRYGENAWFIRCDPDEALPLLRSIDESMPEVIDVAVGEGSVLVQLDPSANPAVVKLKLLNLAPLDLGDQQVCAVTLPVAYDGPDLDTVATATGLSTGEIVARHVGARYTVAFCGFAPGFAYLVGLDPALHVPRLDIPRARVSAGAVGIARHYSAVYPSASPGGWQLIGHCDVELFNPLKTPAALLTPGTQVTFTAVRP